MENVRSQEPFIGCNVKGKLLKAFVLAMLHKLWGLKTIVSDLAELATDRAAVRGDPSIDRGLSV